MDILTNLTIHIYKIFHKKRLRISGSCISGYEFRETWAAHSSTPGEFRINPITAKSLQCLSSPFRLASPPLAKALCAPWASIYLKYRYFQPPTSPDPKGLSDFNPQCLPASCAKPELWVFSTVKILTFQNDVRDVWIAIVDLAVWFHWNIIFRVVFIMKVFQVLRMLCVSKSSEKCIKLKEFSWRNFWSLSRDFFHICPLITKRKNKIIKLAHFISREQTFY